MLSSAFDPKRGHPHKWTVTHHYGTQKLYIVFTWIPNNRSGESPFSVGYVAGSNDGVRTVSWTKDFSDPPARECEAPYRIFVAPPGLEAASRASHGDATSTTTAPTTKWKPPRRLVQEPGEQHQKVPVSCQDAAPAGPAPKSTVLPKAEQPSAGKAPPPVYQPPSGKGPPPPPPPYPPPSAQPPSQSPLTKAKNPSPPKKPPPQPKSPSPPQGPASEPTVPPGMHLEYVPPPQRSLESVEEEQPPSRASSPMYSPREPSGAEPGDCETQIREPPAETAQEGLRDREHQAAQNSMRASLIYFISTAVGWFQGFRRTSQNDREEKEEQEDEEEEEEEPEEEGCAGSKLSTDSDAERLSQLNCAATGDIRVETPCKDHGQSKNTVDGAGEPPVNAAIWKALADDRMLSQARGCHKKTDPSDRTSLPPPPPPKGDGGGADCGQWKPEKKPKGGGSCSDWKGVGDCPSWDGGTGNCGQWNGGDTRDWQEWKAFGHRDCPKRKEPRHRNCQQWKQQWWKEQWSVSQQEWSEPDPWSSLEPVDDPRSSLS